MSELKVFPDREALSRGVAETFLSLAADATRDFGVFTVALAGGTTPRRAYEIVAQTWRDAPGGPLDWSRVHLFWGDERHVPPSHPESNYRMAKESLIRHVPVPVENVHPISAEHPDAGKAAAYYEEELRDFFQLGAGQLPRFHLILLGMGADGHVASLFPETEALEVEDRLVAANWLEMLETWRITMTLPVLNDTANLVVMVAEAEKSDTLRRVIEGPHPPPLLPAERLKPGAGTLIWLADKEAAGWRFEVGR